MNDLIDETIDGLMHGWIRCKMSILNELRTDVSNVCMFKVGMYYI